MPRYMLRLVKTIVGTSALLYPAADRALTQETEGSGRIVQEVAQAQSQRPRADRPAERAKPKAPALEAAPPSSSIAPPEQSVREPVPSPASAGALAWTAQEVADGQAVCLKALAPIRASIDVSTPLRSGDCGTLGAVTVRSVGGVDPVAVSPASPLTCPMVVSLHDWVELGLQPIARALLGVPIASLTGVATYQCRDRVGSTVSLRSEHAVANAIDITAFVTTDGRTVDVKAHWGATNRDGSPPPTLKAAAADPKGKRRSNDRGAAKSEIADEDAKSFLKAVHRAACRNFTTVLGPEANEAHRDHFHFDLAQRRSGYRLCE